MNDQAEARGFGATRILFGVIWAVNTYLQTSPAYAAHFLKMFGADTVTGQPHWVVVYGKWAAGIVGAMGAVSVAHVTIMIDGLLALSLLTGLGFPTMGWVGLIYNLWLWSTIGGFGGPYTKGVTDPGTAIIYALCFFLVIATRAWQSVSLARRPPQTVNLNALHAGRIAFGLLWLFDAFWKWQPFFLHHVLSYLKQARLGEPAWIKAYIEFFIHVLTAIGPLTFGVAAALAETAIAISLLMNIALRWMIPFGIVYSLGIWTTAEGWGAPYGAGFTANKGDVLGTTNIYVIAFLFIAANVYLNNKEKFNRNTKFL
ncbi:hypothetical protein [Acidiphilium iwatense]|uniref:DoxX family protein n=1 Tax=Acidiphilium iwatense TaxID=768198 RepID=A0ABS9E159_9PROT|nr:hypothetical protein [Acidiphilium iwatense]MCF3948673.1 hypothetical protein [Acidiphilium iwatense]